ncbi:dockerin type I repeat-containing protein [Ruminococcus sp.]|uniref:dockerin type I repeat-containing protein n=1 Tax=Ruminococcus sp. TaxID=41978 RepID=UPI0025EC67C9|nr:dockerin type I repeat-containing protein [Ruminococcus sp.]
MKSKKKFIRALALMLTIFTSVSATHPFISNIPMIASAAEQQTLFTGTCGADNGNITWSYDTSTETMTFSGTGAMEVYYLNGINIDNLGVQLPEELIIPEWLTDSRIPSYNAKHVVFEEGITDAAYVCKEFFGENATYCTITVPESMENINLEYVQKSCIYYGLYGSKFYYQCESSPRFVGTGIAKDPLYPTSGTSEKGASWNFNYETNTLTISGPGTVDANDIMPPADTIVFTSDFIPPENSTTTFEFNEYVYIHTFLFISEGKQKVYCYPGSPFAQEYEKVVSYFSSHGNPSSDFSCTYIENAPICGDANLDGVVDITDAVLLKKATNNSIVLNDLQTQAMDCNGDQIIDSNDALLLLQFLVHIVDSLPLNS